MIEEFMLEKYLPETIYNAVKKYLNLIDVNEIRIRLNSPIIVSVKNKKYYLGENGFSSSDKAIICDYTMLQDIVYKLCENSIYSVNDNLKCGFITLPKGIRVGISGEVVTEDGKVRTIKNFQAINIRIPHNIVGCSEFALDYILDKEFNNTLIISPPGAGKTTFIKDIVYQLYRRNYSYNILVVDERNEIAGIDNGELGFDLGGFADVYTNCSKDYAFKFGIRSMRPDIIVTDEIDIDKDLQAIVDATNCGVKVLATIHSGDIRQLKQKRKFDEVVANKVFDRYVLLSLDEGPGTLKAIYDGKFQCLYCR